MEREPAGYEDQEKELKYDKGSESDTDSPERYSSARRLVMRFFQWRKSNEISKDLKKMRRFERDTQEELKRTTGKDKRLSKIKKLLNRNRNEYRNTQEKVDEIDIIDGS